MSQELNDYVKNAKAAGQTDDQIKEQLNKQGWTDESLGDQFKKEYPAKEKEYKSASEVLVIKSLVIAVSTFALTFSLLTILLIPAAQSGGLVDEVNIYGLLAEMGFIPIWLPILISIAYFIYKKRELENRPPIKWTKFFLAYWLIPVVILVGTVSGRLACSGGGICFDDIGIGVLTFILVVILIILPFILRFIVGPLVGMLDMIDKWLYKNLKRKIILASLIITISIIGIVIELKSSSNIQQINHDTNTEEDISEDPIAKFKTYKDPLFLIEYPSHWIVDEAGNTPTQSIVNFSPPRKDPGIGFGVSLSERTSEEPQNTPENSGDDIMESLRSGFQNFRFTKKRSVIIGGRTGVTYEYSGDVNNESITGFMAVTTKNNLLYTLTFVGDTNLYNENKELLEVLLESFSIK